MCYQFEHIVDIAGAHLVSTTAIRLKDTLRDRVLAAAERAGTTAHAFMLDAIAQTVAWNQAKAYLAARAQGGSVRKPATRSAVAKAK